MTPRTITNCYRKAGFVLVNQTDEANPDSVSNEPAENEPEDTDEFRNIWTRLREVYGDCVPRAVDDYTSVDDLAQTSAELNDDDIVQVVRDPSLEGNLSDEDDDDQMELEAPAPKLAEAYSALRTLRYYGLGVESTEMENLTHRMESLLMHQSQQAMVQKRITDFMKWNVDEMYADVDIYSVLWDCGLT